MIQCWVVCTVLPCGQQLRMSRVVGSISFAGHWPAEAVQPVCGSWSTHSCHSRLSAQGGWLCCAAYVIDICAMTLPLTLHIEAGATVM
jgi:hypothetical protein